MRISRILFAAVFLAMVCLATKALAQTNLPSDALKFKASTNGGFSFDTGVLRGTLRAGGKSDGLLPVIHIPTDKVLDRSKGFFGHYRVFTTNKRYGEGAWYWESSARLLPDGAVETHWPATNDRPFELWAVYRWKSPETLDVQTKVLAHADLTDFESFLACYFNGFSNSMVCARGENTGKKFEFLAATPEAGKWQMFPRDEKGVKLIKDGRWTYKPSPVDWTIRPFYAVPLGVRRDDSTGLAGIIMAPGEDSYAVATPQQLESHYSMYLAQFGRDLKAGESAVAHARLVIATNPTETDIVKLYREYLAEFRKAPAVPR